MIGQGLSMTLDDRLAAQVAASAISERLAAVFERYDLLATPTAAVPAFPAGLAWGPGQINGQGIDPHLGWFFTWTFNLTGHPAISLLCDRSREEMPYGFQLVGRRRAGGLVLRVAAAIEDASEFPGRPLPKRPRVP
jgi:Asp-tRNA(Asn)/Glu-tRNA(Gln) amidotransferase A subunit family amidase